ncbi:MAG: adenosylcobinamide-GDP ribazoletransferase [Qingshengfaniella sp.]
MTDGPGLRFQPADLATAALLLTRLPLPRLPERVLRRGAAAAWCYPLIGVALGGLAAGVLAGAQGLGLDPATAAALALACAIVTTGALHEDGLADCADGFWGGHDRSRRLEIMKDSRMGSYGVIALGLSLLIKWSALAALATAGLSGAALIFAAATSRALITVIWATLPPARPDGLAASQGRPGPAPAGVALGLALLSGLVLLPLGSALAGLAAALIAGGAVALVARGKIGGQTGDVLGATQQIAEIAVLLTLTALRV